EVEAVPGGGREDVQVGASSDDTRAAGEVPPVREDQPVLRGALHSRVGQLSGVQAVAVGAVSAVPGDAGAIGDERLSGDAVTVPAGEGPFLDADDGEVGVVARPSSVGVDVKCVAVAYCAPRIVDVGREAPVDLQIRGEAYESAGADRFAVIVAPAVVAVNAFVEVTHPDVAGGSGEDVFDAVPECFGGQGGSVGGVDDGVAVGAVLVQSGPGGDGENSAVRERLDGRKCEGEVGDGGHAGQRGRLHRDAHRHRVGGARIRERGPTRLRSRGTEGLHIG